ncbi:MAG: hypothetical protein Q9M22_06015 [Mariprofundaceae bacterium]|nr:hypothetical protein [Mariprofundaceae bacterium]
MITTNKQRGFSMFKMAILLIILAGILIGLFKVFPVYYIHYKVQHIFEATSKEMADDDELKIRARLPILFQTQAMKRTDVPQEFYDNLRINAGYGRVELSSKYHVIVWLMGPVESADPNSDYDPVKLKGIDKMRHQARMDVDFEVYAKTPGS